MFQHDRLHSGLTAANGIPRPKLAWTLHVQGEPGSPAIGPDGTIYVATGMLNFGTIGYLYAITPAGAVKWRFKLPGLPASTTPAIASDGTIYLHMNGLEGNQVAVERLIAITPAGTKKCIFQTNGGAGSVTSYIQSSPVIGPNGTIYFGSEDTHLYALAPNCMQLWAVSPTVSSIDSSPALDVSRNALYIQDFAAELAAYRTDGTPTWHHAIDTCTGGEGSPSAVASSGVIYVATSCHSALYAIRPADGTALWRAKLGGNAMSTPAIGPDGTIYIGDDYLYAFTPAGVLKWKRLHTQFSSASPVVTADGTIYWDARSPRAEPNRGWLPSTPTAPPGGRSLSPPPAHVAWTLPRLLAPMAACTSPSRMSSARQIRRYGSTSLRLAPGA